MDQAVKEVLSLPEKDRPKAADEIKARLNLDELYSHPRKALELCRIGKCRICDETVLTHPLIMGIGSEPSKLMLVGEAPGKNEDYEGRPFIGRSGQQLKEMLQDAGIENPDDEVFITNAVRCRPKENRDPTLAEIKACSGFLKAEIREVKPNLVLTLGNIPLRAFYGQTGITSLRGIEMWSTDYNVKFLPTVHPASILHGNIQSEVWIERDIRKAVRCSETREFTPFEEPEIYVVKDLADVDQLINLLLEQEEFAFDLETSGLNMFEEGAHILCVSFSWDKKKAGVIPLDHPENPWNEEQWLYIVGRLEELFLSPVKKIGQNVKFDVKWLEAILKFKVSNVTFDTMLAHYSFFEFRGTQGLKQMAADYLNFPEYNLETEYLKGISKNKRYFGMVPLEPLCKYAAMDANATFRLKELFLREMIKVGTSNVFKTLLMPLSNRLTEMEMLGIKIDTVYLTKLQKEVEEKLANIDAGLLTYPSGMQLKEWCISNKKTLNFNSDAHIRVLLFQFEGLHSMKSTPTGMPSVSQEVLEQMDTQNPIIALLLERSHMATLYDNFIEKTWLVIDDGKVHPSYKIHGTETGRLSCENPNYQQIPREEYIKKMFVGDTEEFLYMDADYSQIELRVIAALSGDKSMREIFARGEDIHTAMASKIFNKPLDEITKDERYRAKTMNFSILYGKGTYSVAMDLGITPEEAKVFIEQFFREVPGVQRWIKDTQNIARKTGMVKSPFGRLRHIPEVRSTDRERAAKSLREAVNMPVQSAASDITATAFLKLADIFEENKFKSRLVGLIHDSISVVVHKTEKNKIVPIVKQTMEGLRFPWMGSVPIVVEIKIGKSWGEIEAITEEV